MKRELSKEEVEDREAQIREWELQTDVLESEVIDLTDQIQNIDDSLVTRMTALNIELKSLKRDHEKDVSKRQMISMQIKKRETLERTKLNIKALKTEIEEGLEVKDESSS